jgi:hypothetical protein
MVYITNPAVKGTPMDFTSLTWNELPWTAWIFFNNLHDFKQVPPGPGVYRIRARGEQELFYIGETGRNLRARLHSLRLGTMNDQMPYNDPHTAAPSLWAWRDAEGIDFECSAAPVILADDAEEARRLREGLECSLLWQYRLEFGSSTRCNHGRFHPRYLKSGNRKGGFRGYHLPEDAPSNKDGGPSLPPLQMKSNPLEGNWMGLPWSDVAILQRANLGNVPNSPGVYRIFDLKAMTLLYIGESKYLRNRLIVHTTKTLENSNPLFSYVQFSTDIPKYQLREMENDLIGAFYTETKQIPKYQFGYDFEDAKSFPL